jgi:polyhydroxybutyrate depolymerase
MNHVTTGVFTLLLASLSLAAHAQLDHLLVETVKRADTINEEGQPPATSGPRAARLQIGDQVRSVTVGKLLRRYRLYVPKAYNAERPTPVVVVFHGGGGNPESMVRLTGMNAKADTAGFIVVYPYGSGRDPERGLTFNGGGCCAYAMLQGIDDVAFTRALLDDLATVANVDTNRVYATGLSNGGIMSYFVASELSDRIAAIAPVGGPMMLEASRATRPVSVMHFHGTADEFAPIGGGFGKGPLGSSRGVTEFRSVDHAIKNWVKANGCTPAPSTVLLPDKADDGMRVTRKTWGGCKQNTEVVLIEIEGGGHTWPGMPPPATLGRSTMDISANDLMWEFFQRHPKAKTAND